MQAAQRTSCSRFTAELPAPHHSTPTNNYFSGDGKSYVWGDASYYVPSERSWIRYPDYRSLPRESRRDAKDFQSEDEWVNFMRNRDQPTGCYFPNRGMVMSRDSGLVVNAYARVDPAPPGLVLFRPPKPHYKAFVAPIRKNEGDYHTFYRARMEKKNDIRQPERPKYPFKELDARNDQSRYLRHRELPMTTRIDPSNLEKNSYNSRWGFDQP
ncbi:uncharacterized protein [Littorina saxatilis]|uniref:uncharacterized protein isoform X1 n=1 Tax=Littorina saxatilis TaxID=31220 RepID=UPI0038B686D4